MSIGQTSVIQIYYPVYIHQYIRHLQWYTAMTLDTYSDEVTVLLSDSPLTANNSGYQYEGS